MSLLSEHIGPTTPHPMGVQMTLRSAWDVLSTIVVTTCAVILLSLYLHDRAQGGNSEKHFSDWEDWSNSAIRMGAEKPPMVISAFMDFSCPYCRRIVPMLDSVRTEYGENVAIEFHHFPLANHKFAKPAAVAAECADQQGKFVEMYHGLYAKMDSLGVKPWTAFAEEAGLGDIRAFAECIQRPAETFSRIAAGDSLGRAIGVIGTPTLWVNGTKLTERSMVFVRERAEDLGVRANQSYSSTRVLRW